MPNDAGSIVPEPRSPEAVRAPAWGARRLLSNVPALLGVVLLAGAIYAVHREFRHLQLRDITAALKAIPAGSLAFSFVWTVLSYFVLTFYDRLGTIYAGHKVSYGRVAFASFCAYSLAHNLGFAAVSGAAVRYRLYAHWGLTPFQIGKTVAFCSLTFALGGLVLGGVLLITEPTSLPFFGEIVPLIVLRAIGVLLLAVVVIYVTLSGIIGSFTLRGHVIEFPGLRMGLVQVALATVDVAITATIFYALLPAAPGLTWTRFLGVYVASYTAGLAANLPGGIGVFDTAMLFGLEPFVSPPEIVGAILVFRLYYYIIPLFLAGGLFAGNEIVLRGGRLLRAGSAGGAVGASAARWSEPDFAVAAATGLVSLCGAVLLGLGIIAPQTDYSWLDPDFAGIATQASQFVPSLIGAGLVIMALGLSQRVNLAWWLTIVLLLAGAGFAATRDDELWVVIGLIGCAVLLAPFRSCFYRHASLLTAPLDVTSAAPLFLLLVCVVGLALERHKAMLLNNDAWWAVIMAPEMPHSVRLAVALAVVLAAGAIWLLVRPGRVAAGAWDAAAARRLFQLGGTPPAAADGTVTGETDRAIVPFRRAGRVLLGLGDPAGADSDKVSAVWRLRDLAHQEGRDPAFWNVGSELLKVYADLGLTALPLGPNGQIVPARQGPADPDQRYLVCVAERDVTALMPLLGELRRGGIAKE